MTDLIAVPREQLEPAGPCPVCGTKDRATAYPPLPDRLCGTPGSWTLMRCAGCGLLIQDPRYTRENIGRAYENYSFHIGAEQSAADAGPTDPMSRPYRAHAYGYDDGLPWWRRARAVMSVPRPEGAEAVGFSVMYLRPVPGGEVLDVGCGGGAFLTFMRSLGWRTLGVEPDRRAVEVARERGLDVRQGTLGEQRFEPERFDAVTSSHVIEHVHDPLEFLAECARVVKPGGRVVVITPNIQSLGRRWLGPAWIGLDPPRHLYLFSCASLRRLAIQAGLSVLSVRSSVRNAEFSWLIAKGVLPAWPQPGQLPPRGWDGFLARAFQLAGWALTLLGVPAGEEIVLIATRR